MSTSSLRANRRKFADDAADLDIDAIIAEIDRTEYAPAGRTISAIDIMPVTGRRVPAYRMAA